SNIKSIKSFYLKRFINIIVPFIIYSFLHFLIMNRDSTLSINICSDYFLKILNGSLSVHFWFVYVIIGMYLFTPVFSYIINSISDRTLNLSFIALLIAYLINMYSINLTIINIKIFEIPYLNYWYLYFFIGGYIGRKKFTMSKEAALSFIFLGYALTAVSIYKTKDYPHLMPFDAGINMIILSTSIFLFFARTDFTVSRGVTLIPLISKHTYGVYLIHMAILNVIYIYFMTRNIVYNAFMMICACFIISLIISYVTDNILINRITMLSGVSRILSTPDRK
ncbi:acyltransferase, partial [Salmonella enterica subsp. arizonae]|nr:acyltransferase [Salmonella enterica subsp. arizonae]